MKMRRRCSDDDAVKAHLAKNRRVSVVASHRIGPVRAPVKASVRDQVTGSVRGPVRVPVEGPVRAGVGLTLPQGFQQLLVKTQRLVS